MNIVDSSGWLEYLGEGKNAAIFAPIVTDVEHLIVPSICIYEVFKRIAFQLSDEEALEAVGVMSLGRVVDLDRQLALEAAQISLMKKMAMADSIILATARFYNAILWTQDADFKDSESIKYIEK